MSRIKELRASIEKKIDALEQQALALEAQLTQTKDQAVQRLEQGKQQLREVVMSVQADLRKSKDIADHVKADVQAKLDHLQVQLALGKAEARDAFDEQREKIFKALNEFETIADQKLTGVAFDSGRLWEQLVGRSNSLDAEFDALKHRLLAEGRQQLTMVEATKQELLQQLRAYRDDLRVKRQMVRARADTFDLDLREGLEQIKTAFRRLFE
ncbi:MAG: hypothetical protein H8K10_02240 [Nitrospira sp.]|nr:hypothetical protein [Nitrospira sp.]